MLEKKAFDAYAYLRSRGVTRLCHFTKTKALVHILTGEDGILATGSIDREVRQQNDLARLDGALDHVCCSVQYPNSWYWRQAKSRDRDAIFREWVVLTIRLEILRAVPFRSCCCNASRGHGAYIESDPSKISMLFQSPILTGRTRRRGMLECCPTDDQAEIMIYKNIPYRYISGIIVGSEDSADHIMAILRTIGREELPIYVSPSVCSTEWSGQVRTGIVPLETEYCRGDEDDG